MSDICTRTYCWESTVIISGVLRKSLQVVTWPIMVDSRSELISCLHSIHALVSESPHSLCMRCHWMTFFSSSWGKSIGEKYLSCLSMPQISYNQIWLHFCFAITKDTPKSRFLLTFHFFKLVMFLKLLDMLIMCFLGSLFTKRLTVLVILGKSSTTPGRVPRILLVVSETANYNWLIAG